jgi:predicted nucleic acid-binding protein
MVIVDTSVIIDHLRQSDKTKTLFTCLISKETLAISIVTYAELYSGQSVWNSVKASQTVEKLCDNLCILPITQEIAKMAGKIKSSHDLDLVDCLIAATSISNKISLSTLNLKHFQPIPSISLCRNP